MRVDVVTLRDLDADGHIGHTAARGGRGWGRDCDRDRLRRRNRLRRLALQQHRRSQDQAARRLRQALHHAEESVQRRVRRLQVFRLAGQCGQPDQRARRDAVARRRRLVVRRFQAQQQILVIVRRQEEAAARPVPVMLLHHRRERLRLVQPSRIAGGVAQVEQAVREEGVVVQVGVQPGFALAIAAEQAAVLSHRGQDEPGGALGGGDSRGSFNCLPAHARAPIISPFQPASTLSSQCGRTRAARRWRSFSRRILQPLLQRGVGRRPQI